MSHFYLVVGLIHLPDMPKMLYSKGFGCAPAKLDHLVLHQMLVLGMRKGRTPDAVRLLLSFASVAPRFVRHVTPQLCSVPLSGGYRMQS
jgi:hypothetical protein